MRNVTQNAHLDQCADGLAERVSNRTDVIAYFNDDVGGHATTRCVETASADRRQDPAALMPLRRAREFESSEREGFVSKGFLNTIVFTTALVLAPAWAAFAQAPAPEQQTERKAASAEPQTGERRTVGTVTSVGRGSIVLRTDQGAYSVYSVGPDTNRSKPVTVGEHVRVITRSSDTEAAPTALAITVVPRPQGLAAPPAEPDVVPEQVRSLEAQIERQARRFRAGFQAGAAIDPELISLDAFATLGPFFKNNINFRPNVEFAFGEVTTLFGIHLDAIYTLPGVTRSIKWAPYVGGGPSFSFSHRGFEATETDTEVETTNGTVQIENGRFDLSSYEWHNGFNFIVGAKNANGTFFEMKSTAWGAANIRLMAGFEF